MYIFLGSGSLQMNRRNDFLIPLLTLLSDIIATEAAFLIAYTLRFSSFFASIFPINTGVPPLSSYIYSSFVVALLWIFLFQSNKLYGARRRVYPVDEFFNVVKIISTGMLIAMGVAFFYRGFSYSRLIIALIWIFSIILIFAGRWAVLSFEKRLYRRGEGLRLAVLIGNNEIAHRIAREIVQKPELGYQLVGYFTTHGSNSAIDAIPHLGAIDEAPDFFKKQLIEVAIISIDTGDYPQLEELLRQSAGLNIEFLLVPDLLELMTTRVRIMELEGIPLLRVKEIPLSSWGKILKRSFDLVLASLGLILTAPIMAVIALAVKLDSRGPVFYHQERVGMDGKPFHVIKFRTMIAEAEKETGPVWAKENDPRVTRVGRFLRRSSLDELPQLLNVIKGEMSLVGPRPERSYFVEKFKDQIPKYLDRHRVKTGMTGWAQVNGLRGNVPIEERTKYDIYYIENWSLWFDIKILLKTIIAVLTGKNAY